MGVTSSQLVVVPARGWATPVLSLLLVCSFLGTHGEPLRAETCSCPSQPLVLLRGLDLPDLLGLRTETLRVITWRNGTWVSLPFQIDERDNEGRYLLDRERVDGVWVVPSGREGDGILTERDEVLFSAEKIGELGSEALKGGPWMRIRLSESRSGTAVGAWIGSGHGILPLPEVDFVRFDPERHSLATDHYQLAYQNPSIPGLPSHFFLIDARNGRRSPNLLAGITLEIALSALWGGIEVTRRETELNYHLIGYRDGPIRVLLRDGYALKLLANVSTPTLEVMNFAYGCGFELPAVIHVPFSPDLVLTEMNVAASLWLQHLPPGRPLEFVSPSKGFELESHTSEVVFKFDTPTTTNVSYPGFGAFDVTVGFPRASLDTMGLVHAPRVQKGASGPGHELDEGEAEIGFEALSAERIKRGTYPLILRVSVSPEGRMSCGTAPYRRVNPAEIDRRVAITP